MRSISAYACSSKLAWTVVAASSKSQTSPNGLVHIQPDPTDRKASTSATSQAPGTTEEERNNEDTNTDAVDDGDGGEDNGNTPNEANLPSPSGVFSFWLLIL